MLTVILAITLAVADLGSVERAYHNDLQYQVVDRGTVDPALAGQWGAPAAAGRNYVLMQPASGEPVYLRLVQQDAPPAPAMKTHGWNSNEILVEDPEALNQRLAKSAFRVIGPPKGLDFNPAVVAMQAIGPAEELVYLTRIPPGKSRFNLGTARTFVDRTFIVVAGGPDLEAMRRFYAEGLGVEVTPSGDTEISVLADAWNLPAKTRFPIAIAQLPVNFLIELDGYPAGATPRAIGPGQLPPGMAMVSFGVKDLDQVRVPLASPPVRRHEAPYFGRRVATTRGAAGEWIELVERIVP